MAQRSRSRQGAAAAEGGKGSTKAVVGGAFAAVVCLIIFTATSPRLNSPPAPDAPPAAGRHGGIDVSGFFSGGQRTPESLAQERTLLSRRLDEINKLLRVPFRAAPVPATPPTLGCVGWRQTGGCDPDGPREAQHDLDCGGTVPETVSGYCDCDGGARRIGFECGHESFKCEDQCAPKSKPTPSPPLSSVPTPAPRPPAAVANPLPPAPRGKYQLPSRPRDRPPRNPAAEPWRGSPADLVDLAGLPDPSDPLPPPPNKDALFSGVTDATTNPPRTDPASLPYFTSSGPNSDPSTRREAVLEALHHSFKHYTKIAWGRDELKPVSGRPHEWAAGSIGLTIVEALPTLWLAGLHEEFHRGRDWVREKMNVKPRGGISPFEFTIRVVGGLLSAYEVSGERFPEFVQRAKEVADRLLKGFDEDGLPAALVDMASGFKTRYWGWAPAGALVMSEFTSLQLEYRTLSLHTKDPSFDMAATWCEDMAIAGLPPDGLPHAFFRRGEGYVKSTRISVTAHGDSYYEYLLKQYLLTGGKELRYKQYWEKAANALLRHVVVRYPEAGITTINEGFRNGANIKAGTDMDHLACFAGGMFALGSLHLQDSSSKKEYFEAGRNITHACRAIYSAMPGGIAPEISAWSGGREGLVIRAKAIHYNLRPEYAESLFYLWRTTRDPIYREWGWDMFNTLQKNCRTKYGFAGLKDVRPNSPPRDDWMPGFFFSETLKYLLLLFSDDSLVPLDRWVFNTEGHPLKIRERDPLELWPMNIRSERETQMTLGVAKLSQLYRSGKAWIRRAR
eukprot:Hpha_TRINITY_DN16906_c1_g14::TRINITY_DN16906_c1_g14_i1::g.55276::m.55276/K01230/MAN1; mannosyl-oligosaccharide alpha-1,2-mannosidase